MQKYLELRTTSDAMAADIVQHWQTRINLGKALVICDDPSSFLTAAHKQWQRLTRQLQDQRLATVDVDKILELTRQITLMQRTIMSDVSPISRPEAHLFFVRPSQLLAVPIPCFSLYVATNISAHSLSDVIEQLPGGASVVGYDAFADWFELDLAPKKLLLTELDQTWQQLQVFFTAQKISVDAVGDPGEQFENTLDTLLGTNDEFLRLARPFQRLYQLAKPTHLPFELLRQYELVLRLAHRVEALTPGHFTKSFLQMFEDDQYTLHDGATERYSARNLADLITRHHVAGRFNLVRALQALA